MKNDHFHPIYKVKILVCNLFNMVLNFHKKIEILFILIVDNNAEPIIQTIQIIPVYYLCINFYIVLFLI